MSHDKKRSERRARPWFLDDVKPTHTTLTSIPQINEKSFTLDYKDKMSYKSLEEKYSLTTGQLFYIIGALGLEPRSRKALNESVVYKSGEIVMPRVVCKELNLKCNRLYAFKVLNAEMMIIQLTDTGRYQK